MRYPVRLTAAAAALVLLAAMPVSTGGALAGTQAAVDGLYALPLSSGTTDPARDLLPEDPRANDLVLVQWEEFGDPDIVHALADTGALLVQPLAPVSYLVWADGAQTRDIRALPGVRFAGVLPPAARIAGSVAATTTALRITAVGGPLELAGADWGARAFTQVDGAVAQVPGGLDVARALAQDPRVYSIADAGGPPQLRDEQSSQIVAQGTVDGAHAQPGYRNFLADAGADGTGVTVHIQDGGVDFNHPDLSGQVATCFDSSPIGLLDPDSSGLCRVGNNDDAIGHGTHVLGVILATGATPFADSDGFQYGLGMAPGARAVVHNDISLNSFFTSFPGGFEQAYQQAVEAGASVSNNSWGPAGTPQGYDDDTRRFDMITRDANPGTPFDEPIALSWSIMNGSGGTSTQGSPDEAKNIIAVGASGARGTRSPDDLCTCTAHGPNLDGRRLVDIVAPGQAVVSTRATQGTLCGTGVSGGFVNIPPSPLHGPCTGTSFASPHVTGAIAVFTQWFRDNVAGDTDTRPSPPLLKAALANTADDLSTRGGVDADGNPLQPIPNDQQGWGRINLGNLLQTWSDGVVFIDQDVAFTRSGQRHRVRVRPIDPDAPIKVTLAWADAPGHGLGGDTPAWVNDLDLVVSRGGTTWLGNDFEGGWSTTGGQRDERNNLEAVHIERAGDRQYMITVQAANLLGPASPNADELLWQDFALVISNAQLAGPPGRP